MLAFSMIGKVSRRTTLVPAFRSSCITSARTFNELRKVMGTSKPEILVPLFHLKFLDGICRLRCRNFKWAAPGLGKFRFAASALLLGPVLSGCILGTERPDLNLDVPAAYREGGRTTPDAHLPAVDWWRGFKSSELTSLMDAAQLYNLDIAVAIAQIVQADAQVGINGAPLLPSVSGTASAEQSRSAVGSFSTGGGIGGQTFSQYSLGLTA